MCSMKLEAIVYRRQSSPACVTTPRGLQQRTVFQVFRTTGQQKVEIIRRYSKHACPTLYMPYEDGHMYFPLETPTCWNNALATPLSALILAVALAYQMGSDQQS